MASGASHGPGKYLTLYNKPLRSIEQPVTARRHHCHNDSVGLTFYPAADIPKDVKYDPLLHIVLFQPEIPPNTGSVGRTCVAVGAKLWLVRPLGFRVDSKTLRRAGLDYWQHLEWEVVDHWQALLEQLPSRKFWYFTKTATRLYTDANYQPGDVLVFGCETQGLPAALLAENPDRLLRIPIREQVRSLNLASAVAVPVFEALRQFSRESSI